MRSVSMLSTLLCLAALSPMAANAASVTFNFNSTAKYPTNSFIQPGQTLTPDVGTGQTATIGILNASNATMVFGVVNSTFSGFAPKGTVGNTGQNIQDLENTADVFQMTFSHAIHTFSLNFTVAPGTNTPTVNANPLKLTAFSNVSSATPLATALATGDAYSSSRTNQYFGSITLSSVVGFSTLDIGLFNPDNNTGDTFSFDDVVADDSPVAVPEPGAIALAVALGLPAAWRLKKSRQSRS